MAESGVCLLPHLFVAVVLTTDKLAQAVIIIVTIALTDPTLVAVGAAIVVTRVAL